MIVTPEVFTTFVVSSVLLWISLKVRQLNRRKKSNLPSAPGPMESKFALLTNVPLIFRFSSLTELAKSLRAKYGGIIEGDFLLHRLLLVSDRELLSEVCKHKNIQGRPAIPCLVARGVNGGQYVGITANESRCWNEMRSFAFRSLKELGLGKPVVEESLAHAAAELVQHLKEKQNVPVDTTQIFCLAINIPLLKMLTSHDLSIDDPLLQYLYTSINGPDTQFFQEKLTALHTILPGVASLFPNFFGVKKFEKLFGEGHRVLQKIIDEHEATRDKGTPRDLIDLYLNKMDAEAGDPTSGFYQQRGINNLKSLLVDLLGGNTEMSNWILTQFFLYMGHYPEVKERVVAEIKDVIGPTRAPRWEDRHNMPYTRATMEEMLRVSSLLHAGVERRVTADTELKGYFIPKECLVIPWLYGANHDETYWGSDVDEFKPERFLKINEKSANNDSQGQGQGQNQDGKGQQYLAFSEEKSILTFGSGPRGCPGEFLGRITLFIFFTTLMQNLDFTFDPQKPLPTLVPNEGHVLSPKKFKLVFSLRSQ